MWYKNAKLWAALITVLLSVVFMATGVDIKKSICEAEPAPSDLKN